MTGQELKQARVSLGLNQESLGNKLGLTREWIGRMERGQCHIDIRTELAVRYLVTKKS